MNRTGLATVLHTGGITDLTWLFYQDSEGDIRYDRKVLNGSWQVGERLGLSDCMAGSSLAAVSINLQGSAGYNQYPNVSTVSLTFIV